MRRHRNRPVPRRDRYLPQHSEHTLAAAWRSSVPQAGTGAAEIRRYLERRYLESTDLEALVGGGFAGVEFLARGEYSLNYRIHRASQGGEPDEDLVARLITGSQMNLPLGEQALYEHHALGLLVPSEVTPNQYRVNPESDWLPYPLILEEYLSDRPLSYATDITAAARCITKIHALGVPQNHRL